MSFERAYYACSSGNCSDCMQALEEERNYNAHTRIFDSNRDDQRRLNYANQALRTCFKCFIEEDRRGKAVVKFLEEKLEFNQEKK